MTGERLASARAIARLLDDAVPIPGTNVRVGLDALLGLLPGVGDVTGLVFGGYLVMLAARAGAPGSVVARMIVNLALDTAIGAVPLLGDVADIAWKANRRNLALLERALAQPERERRRSALVLGGALAGLATLAAAGAALAVWGLAQLVRAIL